MICINHAYTEPYFNMALEEYLLKNVKEDIFLLWRNEPAIIVGRYQNTLSEINIDFVKENNIKVVRRLTGGGAVFHDLGNLNFTFIKNGENTNFEDFTRPILEMLQELGVNACFEGRNDLTIEGKKFSGNAILVEKNRILEHGTLLFSSQMSNLADALKVSPLKFEDKAVKSIQKRVTNISDHLKSKITVLEFRDKLMTYVASRNKATNYQLSVKDVDAVNELKQTKYATWDWTFGKSPEYTFRKTIRTKAGNIEFNIHTKAGIIEDIKIHGDFFCLKPIEELELLLKGCKHSEKEIDERLKSVCLEDYIVNASVEEFLIGFM